MNEQDQSTTTSDDLSDRQEIVLLGFQICSASLSAIGSFTIMFKIWNDRAQQISMTPYDRIIGGLSSFDIIQSITLITLKFLSPSANIWSFGSPATCQASGLLVQLSIGATWYNCLLSFYFLLTVISQVKRKNYVTKFEVWMHLSVLFVPITAVMGLRRGWYGRQGTSGICWVMDPVIGWIVGGIPVFFTYVALIINYSVIYVVVRKSLSSEHVTSLTSVQKRLRSEAMTLMFLYVTFFFVTMTPTIVQSMLSIYFGYTDENSSKLYPWLLCEVIIYPLQGFFNFFIYIKPMYTRFRIANPNKPMYFVLQQAVFNPNVPQLAVLSNQSASNAAIAEGDAANPNQALFNSNFQPLSSSSVSSSSSSDPYPEGLLDLISGDDDAKKEKSDRNIEEDAMKDE